MSGTGAPNKRASTWVVPLMTLGPVPGLAVVATHSVSAFLIVVMLYVIAATVVVLCTSEFGRTIVNEWARRRRLYQACAIVEAFPAEEDRKAIQEIASTDNASEHLLFSSGTR